MVDVRVMETLEKELESLKGQRQWLRLSGMVLVALALGVVIEVLTGR